MTKLKKFLTYHTISVCIILLFIVLICTNASISIEACMRGLNVWATRLLPALFPFFFLTRLFSHLGGVEMMEKVFAPITRKLFNTDGKSGYIFAMGLLSGYPVSAKLTAELYLEGKLTRGQAYRTITFSSTSGPLFVITTVGLGMFGSIKLGVLIMFAHVIGSVLNGLIYRKYALFDNYSLPNQQRQKAQNILEDAMTSSINSILLIGGYVCFFFVIITLISNNHITYNVVEFISNALGIDANVVQGSLNGVVEITRSCLDLSSCGLGTHAALVLVSTIVSWGGISINLQALTFLKKMQFSTKFYFLSKFTQTLLTLIVSIILCVFI